MNKEIKPECYHSIIQYDTDGCDKCKYNFDCYQRFLKYMLGDAFKNENN